MGEGIELSELPKKGLIRKGNICLKYAMKYLEQTELQYDILANQRLILCHFDP